MSVEPGTTLVEHCAEASCQTAHWLTNCCLALLL